MPPAKLQAYLLNEAHPAGGSKASLFHAFGYDAAGWELLASQLLAIAAKHDVVTYDSHDHGVNYVVDGVLETPIGRKLPVRTVWVVRRNAETASFVTAYPL